MPLKVATGLAIGSKALPELATKAVISAMEKAKLHSPACVLLFLSSEFASNPELAIKAAAKATSCTNIIGCSAIGIFTEEDWVIDSPAAAAMVFSENVWLKPEQQNNAPFNNTLLLTLAAPNAINSAWLDCSAQRLGGVSGDAIGHGAFSVWANAKGITQGYCEMRLNNAQYAVGATHGLKLLTSPRRVTNCNQLDLISIANLPAFDVLSAVCQKSDLLNANKLMPYHQLMVAYASRASHIERGDYRLAAIMMGDAAAGTVTVAKPLQVGDWVSWAVRDMDAAQVDLVKTASTLRRQLAAQTQNAAPQFALLFSCLGRGPYLYNGVDQDLALMKTLFPGLPLIGFYGNGEIASINAKNELLEYSAVIGLFGENNEPI